MKHTYICLFLFFSPVSCQWLDQTAQTGHQEIAASIRQLLDKAYAGADHAAYSASLQSLENIVTAQLNAVPSHLKPHVEQMLSNLRTAEEILSWDTRRKAIQTDKSPLAAWIQRHTFLQAAVGAKADAPDTFDTQTALNLLWDHTNEILRDVQVKNSPI